MQQADSSARHVSSSSVLVPAGHSTETAMLCVHNDIVCAVDEKRIAALVLLDLSAAFDTVHHSTLLTVLQRRSGVCNTVLAWLRAVISV